VGKTAELLPGTLDMLILKAVSLKPLHGHDLIAAEWGQSENNRRAMYYTLTAAGRRRLRDETAGWNRLASAIAAALNTTSEEV
jgi:PadR family transcriptional regulator, regulatory protein PadR